MGDDSIKLAWAPELKGVRQTALALKKTIAVENVSEEIKDIFTSLSIPRRVRLNIPRHLVTVRFLKLPSTDDAEIKKMAAIESAKHVPYADEEMVSGYRVIEKQEDGYSSVMIAVAQADGVRAQIQALTNSGLVVESVSLGSEALLLWYLAANPTPSDAVVLLANIDSGHIDVDIIAGDKLVFTRGALCSPENGPAAADRIIKEINVSLAAYKKESKRSVNKIILTGVSSRINELKGLIAVRLNASVEVVDQMHNMPVREGARMECGDASFAELFGLALKNEDVKIDLLPASRREELRLEAVKKNIMIAGAVIILIALTTFIVVMKKLHDKRVYIAYVDSELKKIAPRVKAAKKMAKDIELVTDKLSERPLAIDLVTEIFKITPQSITLGMVEYEERKSVTLRGAASSLSEVFKYVSVLGKSQYFKNVKVKYANKRIGQSLNAADFEIICAIS